MKRILSILVSAPRIGALVICSRIRRLGNADTALFLGWAMVSAGCALVAVPAGLIVGGISLAGGALFTARGSE